MEGIIIIFRIRVRYKYIPCEQFSAEKFSDSSIFIYLCEQSEKAMEFKDKDKFGSFDDYWKANQKWLLDNAPMNLREERSGSGKLNTLGDWVLTLLPVVVMILLLQSGLIHNEVLNLIVALVAGLLAFAASDLLKPFVTGKRSVADIDKDIKEYFRREWEKDN